MNIATTIVPAVAVQDVPATSLLTLLIERNAIAARMNNGTDWTDEQETALCHQINSAENAIMARPATTPGDVIAKLIAAVQVSAEGAELNDVQAARIVAEAQRHFGIGYAHPVLLADLESTTPAASASDDPVPGNWQRLHAAFIAARAEQLAYYDTTMSPAYDRYQAVRDAWPVSHDFAADPVGTAALAAVNFDAQQERYDELVMVEYRTLVALLKAPAPGTAALATKMTLFHATAGWALDECENLFQAMMEDAQRLGGQAVEVGSTIPSPIDALRREYAGLDHQANTVITDSDTDPRCDVVQIRMKEIEQQIIGQPSQSVADARAKMRFLMDTASYGVPLDSEETHIIVKDAARFLVGEEA